MLGIYYELEVVLEAYIMKWGIKQGDRTVAGLPVDVGFCRCALVL